MLRFSTALLLALNLCAGFAARIDGDAFEGDIDVAQTSPDLILRAYGEEEGAKILQQFGGSKRNLGAVKITSRKWNRAQLFFTIHKDVSAVGVKMIHDAMAHIEAKTCFRFAERTNQKDYVEFTESSKCESPIGFFLGKRVVHAGKQCGLQTTIHEIMHSIGFFHESSRPDRDLYIKINWQNIDLFRWDQFKRMSKQYIDSMGSPFDYGSIMLYSDDVFRKRGVTGPTIEKLKNTGPALGKWNGLSALDAEQVRKLYDIETMRPYLTYTFPRFTPVKKCFGTWWCFWTWKITWKEYKSTTCPARNQYCIKSLKGRYLTSTGSRVVDSSSSCGANEKWQLYEGVLKHVASRKVATCDPHDGTIKLTSNSDENARVEIAEYRSSTTKGKFSIRCVKSKHFMSSQYTSGLRHGKHGSFRGGPTGWSAYTFEGNVLPEAPSGHVEPVAKLTCPKTGKLCGACQFLPGFHHCWGCCKNHKHKIVGCDLEKKTLKCA